MFLGGIEVEHWLKKGEWSSFSFISSNRKENIQNFCIQNNAFFNIFLNALQQLMLHEIKILLIFGDFIGILSILFEVVDDKK